MTPHEARCRTLLDEAITLDRDGFVIALDVEIFCQAVELARALELDLPRWLDHVRWFYLSTELLRLLLPDAWHAEARCFAADCAEHALQRLSDPHPDALAALAVAREVAAGRKTPGALVRASQSAGLAAETGRSVSESAALRAAACTVERSVLVAVRGASAGALWSVARATPDRSSRAYAQEQRWQQHTLLHNLQQRLQSLEPSLITPPEPPQ